MARKRSRKPALEYGFTDGAFSLDHCAIFVRAGVEETAAALVEITGAHVWERDVANREVTMRPRAYLLYRLTGYKWTVIVPKEIFYATQEDEALALSKRLGTRVISHGVGSSAGVHGYNLYENGERLEHYYLGEDELEFETRIRPEGYADSTDPGDLDALFISEEAYEPGWRFVDFLGTLKSQEFATGSRWLVIGSADDYIERVDWVAAPERKRRRPAGKKTAEPGAAPDPARDVGSGSS